MQCTMYTMLNACSAQCMQCTTQAMYNVCNSQRMQCTTHAMHNACNAQFMQCTTHAMHNACNAQPMQCTTHAMHNACHAPNGINFFVILLLINRHLSVSTGSPLLSNSATGNIVFIALYFTTSMARAVGLRPPKHTR